MIHIKRFVDKVTSTENKRRDVILPIEEARALKDEITQLLADLHLLNTRTIDSYKTNAESTKIEVSGGKW